MSALPRRIVVDDIDPSIQYSSPGWAIADPSKLNTLGNFGPPYQGTSHSTTTNGANVTFPFNGTSVAVMGTIAITKDLNGVVDPQWACFVDEIQITNPQSTFAFPENNWPLCQQDKISAGSHVLTIQVTTKGTPFYLDNILYTPLPGFSQDGAVLEYTNMDPAVSFDSGWRAWGAQNVTQTTGAQVALNFHGTSVTLIGYTPTELAHTSTFATYTIDGGSPTNIVLQGLPGNTNTTQYNVVELTTPQLKPTTHNLVVTYRGDNTKTPLAVGVFYVTNATSGSTTTASPGATNSAGGSSAPAPQIHSSSHAGAIAGGTIAGCIVLIVLALGLLFLYRRRVQQPTQANPTTRPFMSTSTLPSPGPASVNPGTQHSFAAVNGSTPDQAASGSTPSRPYPQPPPSVYTDPGFAGLGAGLSGYPFVAPGAPGATTAYSGPLVPQRLSSSQRAGSPSGHGHTLSIPSSQAASQPSSSGAVCNSALNDISQPYLQSDHEQREVPPAVSSTAAAIAYPRPAPSTPSPKQIEAEGIAPQRLVRHQDSGIRLPRPVESVVELPPDYSRD